MKGKVLIFDDEVDLLEICKIMLEAKSFKVATSSDCKSVIEDVDKHQPDIIIMDNLIPDIGGVKAIQLIKNDTRHKDLPVILFTASSHIDELAKEAGADDYIRKPFDLEDIVTKLTRHMR